MVELKKLSMESTMTHTSTRLRTFESESMSATLSVTNVMSTSPWNR